MNKETLHFFKLISSYSNHWQSLRWPLLTTLGGMLLLTLLLIGTSVFYFISQNEQLTWQGRQGEAARHAAETVATFIQGTQNTLILISLLKQENLIAEPQMMADLLKRSPALLEVIRLDEDGQVFASAYQNEPLLANLFTIPQSRWFVDSQAGRFYLGNVQISADSEPYLIIAVPAPDGGVVAARLRMNVLWKVVADLHFGETGQTYVVNQDGLIIAHTQTKFPLAYKSLAGRAEIAAPSQAPNYEWTGTYVNFEGTHVVGVTAPVPGTDWIVITELPQLEAFAISRTASLLFGGGMALFGSLVMLVTSRFLGQLILQPMEQLQAGAAQIGSGDLNYRIDIARQDEVGQVAAAFNDMASRLQDHEEKLIITRDQALEASRLKSQLLAKVSHELRTPLGVILGYTELLQNGTFGPLIDQQIQIATEIIGSTQYLTNLVNELLDQAQLESGKMQLHISSFAVKDLLKQVESRMSVLAQAKKLTLTTTIADDVPATLTGDKNRLQQILVNLTSNAIKFTNTGTVQVCLFRPDPTHWAMQVTDTGIGIPREAQTYIFEPFRQVDGSTTREYVGTGLGLSIVKQLTTLMEGQITLESEVGQGSTFTVVLPLKSVQEKII